MRMRNIKREGDIFTMDCYVDETPAYEYKREFSLKFNVVTGEFLSDMTGIDYFYAGHALFRIRLFFANHEPIPSETNYVWY